MLIAIVAGAAVLRLGYVRLYAENAAAEGIFAVQDDRRAELEAMEAGLREARGFVARAPLADKEEPTAHTAIGYPWLLSRLDGYWVGMSGHEREMVRWLQCALGALTAGLYFLFTRRAFHSSLVATVAGVFCAVYPFWIFNAAELNDGTLATFLLALSLFLGVRGGQSGGAATSLLFGLSLAGLACVRAATLPFAIAAILWFLLRCRTVHRGWLYAVLAFLGFVNGLIPVTAWNYQQFRTAIPVADSAYLHLWIGNNRAATGGPMTTDEMESTFAASENPDRLAELREMRQPERYQQLLWDVRDEVRDHPAEFFHRRIRAGLGFFLTTSWLTNQKLVRETGTSNTNLSEWLSQSLPTIEPATLFLLLLLGVLGWRWSYGWRRSAMPSSLALMWIPLPYILGHAEMFHGPRLPLDGVLLSYAALALVCLIPGIGAPLLRGEEPLAA